MSTPCSYGIKKNGIIKSSYYPWDGGINIFGKKFLTEIKIVSLNRLSSLFDKIQMVELDSIPTQEQIDYCKKYGWFDNSFDDRKDTNWFCLLQKTLGSFNQLLLVENENPLMISYPIDGYCYGYLIDFDENLFIVYEYGKIKAIIPLEYIETASIFDLLKCLEIQFSDKSFEDAWKLVSKK